MLCEDFAAIVAGGVNIGGTGRIKNRGRYRGGRRGGSGEKGRREVSCGLAAGGCFLCTRWRRLGTRWRHQG